MTTPCAPATPDNDLCPTADQILPQTLALLPGGRAFGTRFGGPRPGTRLYRYWRAWAVLLAYMNKRICDLMLEFTCETHSETHDVWMYEYGLPDACDPFPDLCTKVRALGGTRCEYYQEIAARAGWSITCGTGGCGSIAGRALAGRARAGQGRAPSQLVIFVHLASSPAYTGAIRRKPLAGRMLAGRRHTCPPDISPLLCVLDRVVHAEINLSYQTVS